VRRSNRLRSQSDPFLDGTGLRPTANWTRKNIAFNNKTSRKEHLFYERAIALQLALEGASPEDIHVRNIGRQWDDVAGSLTCEVPQQRNTTVVPTTVPTMFRKRSVLPECQPSKGPRDDPHFLDHVRPCGNLSSICTDIPLAEANKDYPGGGVGAVRPGQDYVLQFDVGIHEGVAHEILMRQLKEFESCMDCPVFSEQCYETIITGGAMWGNLGLPTMSPRAYDCMGGCGKGCQNILSTSREDIVALDCLKHDLCSAWKSVQLGHATRGFCHDPDCGDEAAMSIFNCWKGFRLFGAVGGNRHGPFADPAICQHGDPMIRGCWSHGGWFTKGRCKLFQGWRRGQGIPDPHPFRSPIQRL